MTAYRTQLDPNRSDGELNYAMRLPFMDMSPIATLGMVSAIAVPAFQRYMQLSRMAGGGMGAGGMGGGSMGGPPGGMGGSGSGGPSPEEMKKMREQLEKQRKQLDQEGLGQ
jgi:hypothetical protein